MAQHSHAPRRVARPEKQNTFFGGAAILAVGIMVVKLIGMFYKIPLINIIGEQGSADFGNAYNIYAVLLTISTAGLPVAVSKLVSEANATGRQNQVRRVFRLSLALFLTLGVLSFLIMSFGSAQLAALMNDDQAAPGIRALAPAVICVGCLSAFRGYAQGHGNMTPTAVSQIIEALCKLVVGLGLAYWLVKAGADQSHAAAGAITGVTVGTIVALAYMLLNYLMGRSREGLAKDTPDSNATIIRNLLMIAVPITISSSMVGIVTVIDSSLVQGQLQRALLENTDCWALYKDFMDFDTLESALKAWQATLPEGTAVSMSLLSDQLADGSKTAGALHDALEAASRTLYGNYNGALNIYNLPTSLMAAITAAVIPAVSGTLARRDRKGASRVAGSALRISALLAFPMGVGLYVLGKPIMALISPQSHRGAGRSSAVHPGPGHGVRVYDAGMQLHFAGLRLCESAGHYHAGRRRHQDRAQLQCSGAAPGGHLRRAPGQHLLLCPVSHSGPHCHGPGHSRLSQVYPPVCQARRRRRGDGPGSLGGPRSAGQAACRRQNGQRRVHAGRHFGGGGHLRRAGDRAAGHHQGGPGAHAKGRENCPDSASFLTDA